MHLHEQAAALHAEANLSDPFAGRRMLAHLSRGYDAPLEVKRESLVAINQRRTRINAEFEQWKKQYGNVEA